MVEGHRIPSSVLKSADIQILSESQIQCLALEGGGGYSECALNNRFRLRNIPISPKSSSYTSQFALPTIESASCENTFLFNTFS